MKQPELGKKISEIRKDKGLTQEELVEKCNITVRTLQRIEAGEVTPRSYTVKTILAALEYDISKISETDDSNKWNFFDWFKDVLVIDIDPDKPADYLVKQLNIAWLFGLLYFILGFPEKVADYYRISKEHQLIFSIPFYTLIKIFVFISFFFFQRGFIIAGHLFKNYLLKIISFVLMVGMLLLISFDIASIFNSNIKLKSTLIAVALAFGVIDILFAVSLIKLQKSFGLLAVMAGVFVMIAGCSFLTVLFAYAGIIVLIPAHLLEIVILYKAVELIKTKKTENEI